MESMRYLLIFSIASLFCGGCSILADPLAEHKTVAFVRQGRPGTLIMRVLYCDGKIGSPKDTEIPVRKSVWIRTRPGIYSVTGHTSRGTMTKQDWERVDAERILATFRKRVSTRITTSE